MKKKMCEKDFLDKVNSTKEFDELAGLFATIGLMLGLALLFVCNL